MPYAQAKGPADDRASHKNFDQFSDPPKDTPTAKLLQGLNQSRQQRWRENNPKADWAHKALQSALNRGLIVRGPCEVCGAVNGENGVIVDSHHPNYDHPLEVVFLCRAHHKQVHKNTPVEKALGGDG